MMQKDRSGTARFGIEPTVGLVIAMLFLLTGSGWALWSERIEVRTENSPTEILVRLTPDKTRTVESLQARFASLGITGARRLVRKADHPLGDIFVLSVKDETEIPGLMKGVSSLPDVLYAEPNLICRILTTPNDPYYSSAGTWGQPYGDLWGLKKIGLEPSGSGTSGWDFVRGDSGNLVVAVIDTGLDREHEDPAGVTWINPGEVPDNGLDDDGNGFVDDVHGWNFVDDTNDTGDDHGHGTHCAGTIGAVGNNAIGIVGVNWGITIMPLKGLDRSGSGDVEGLSEAIVYAADNGAHILSNSWGGSGESETLRLAVQYAASQGCLVLAAAGNDNSDVDLSKTIPARYPEVVAVAATDYRDRKAGFTNFGSAVEISAPGVDILSLRAEGTDMYGDGSRIVGGHYIRANGTSMACPHAAGVAALIWEAFPDLTAGQVRERLRKTADDIYAVNYDWVGKLGTGRINALRAVSQPAGPNLQVRAYEIDDGWTENANKALDPGETAVLLITLSNLWLPASNVTATLRSEDPRLTVLEASANYGNIAEGQTKKNQGSPFLVSLDPNAAYGSEIPCSLELNATGWSGLARFSLKVASPALYVRKIKVVDRDGNGNGFLEPGEEADVYVTFGNGTIGAGLNGLILSATSDGPWLQVLQGTGSIGSLRPGEKGTNTATPFRLSMPGNAPLSATQELRLLLEGSNGLNEEVSLLLQQPNRWHSLWSDYLEYDPTSEVDFFPIVTSREGSEAVHLVWQDLTRVFPYRNNYALFSGGFWFIERWILKEYSDWPYVQSLEVDPDGIPGISWLEYFVPSMYETLVRIRHSFRDGKWTFPDLVMGYEKQNIGFADSGTDGRGRSHLVWAETYYADSKTQSRLYHSILSENGWTPRVNFAHFERNPAVYRSFRMLRDPLTDGFLLVWRGDYPQAIYMMEYDGDTWGPLLTISSQGHVLDTLDCAVSRDGHRHLALFEPSTGKRLYMSSRDNYTSIQVLHSGGYSGHGPYISIGPDRKKHVIFSSGSDLYYCAPDGEGFASPVKVESLPVGGRYRSIASTVDENNHFHILYQGVEPVRVNHVRHMVIPGDPCEAARWEAR